MSSYSLTDLTAAVRAIGRGAVFYGTGAFAGSGNDLSLTHLGDTEGMIEPNVEYALSQLTAPELHGDAPIEVTAAGPAFDLSFDLWAAAKATQDIIQPVAGAPGGTNRPRSVTEYTLAVFPEALFIEDNVEVAVAYTTAGGWTVGGDAASAAQLALIDNSLWIWRGFFPTAATPAYQHDDGGKRLLSVTFRAMVNTDMPDGNVIYTRGNPADESIEIASA